MIPKWKFILTDLHGTVLGEVNNASNIQVVLPLNRLPTCSFQVPMQHPLAHYFYDPTWDGLLKGYRNNILRYNGPIITGNDQGDEKGQTVSVNSAGPFWRLGFRLLGTTAAGWTKGDATTQFDLGTIAQQMITDANTAGYTGIDNGTWTPSTNGSAGTYWFKQVDQAIAEIATGLNSFDFEVAPIEPTNVGQAWPRIGVFNVANLIGTAKQDAIFEYGTTKPNVVSYSRPTTRDQMCTQGFIQQPAASDHSGILSSVDAAAETLRGRFQALVEDSNVQWNILRQALVDQNVKIRKNPRQTLNFQPVQNTTPSPFDDYIVGDQVRCRININNQNVLDAMLRVWGITFAIDQNGNEQPSLELIQP